MANHTRLTNWLVENRATMNPHFTEYTWPKRYFHGIHDIEARITLRDISNGSRKGRMIDSCGRGIDANQELALEKASSEAIERLICLRFGFDSEGFAISGRNGAAEHAKDEALERYYFKSHVDNGRPFSQIDSSSTRQLIERFKLQNANFDMIFYRMATPEDVSGVVCTIAGSNQEPFFLGLALNCDLEISASRAMNESLANYARFCDEPESYRAEVEKNKDAWISKPNFLRSIQSLFTTNETIKLLIEPPELASEFIDTSTFHPLRGCPIEPVRFYVKGVSL